MQLTFTFSSEAVNVNTFITFSSECCHIRSVQVEWKWTNKREDVKQKWRAREWNS